MPNWQQHPYEITGLIIGGIGVIIALIQLLKRGNAPPEVKASSLDRSPVATGSNITQTIIEEQHIHHALVNTPAEQPPRPQRAAKANIRIAGGSKSYVHESLNAPAVFYRSPQYIRDFEAVVADVTNDPRPDGSNVPCVVKTVVLYPEHALRLLGSWLEVGSDIAHFEVDNSHSVVLGVFMDGRFSVPGTRWQADKKGSSFFTDPHFLEFNQAKVTVRLTDANTGDFYCEGHFELGLNPLRITQLD